MLAILPGLLYAKLAYSRRRVAPQVLLKAHFRAEAAKLLLTIALFVVVLLVSSQFQHQRFLERLCLLRQRTGSVFYLHKPRADYGR